MGGLNQVTAVGVVAVLLAASTSGVAGAVPERSAPARPAETITLVTGDRLRLLPGPRGEVAVEVLPVPGRAHVGFLRDGDRVVPSDAQALLDAGRLDPRLFDLRQLPRDGVAPVIVTDAGMALSAPPGTDARSLPSVHGVAMRPTDGFWNWFTSSRASVWLDGIAEPTLDRSVPQIGAPAVWQSGYTGAGVTVGVLDTGVDGGHPDLRDKVVAQSDFTGTGTADQVGHGTHVAGIIAGTGAASGGRYRGVAPDARLISGKVCTTFGCPESAVIAGMEWIAPQARVVNMSLGGIYSDGKDPVSRSLDDLSTRYGTLFVVAAGNDRSLDLPDPRASVTAPAAADRALAVGSVTKEDTTSPFSPRQPRIGDLAVKPDIAAPGSDIVSARVVGTPAGDTAPVDEHYAALSGTSMAAPHVAGTAALLAQRRPGWGGDQLKSDLVSSAKPTADVFEQGAGRVDASRAVAQQVSAVGGGVGFGFVAWPHSTPLSKQVGYRNDGDAPVTLTLTTDAPLFTPSPNQITVPAHGSAQVTVRANPAGQAEGRHSGRLTATAGNIVVRTALTAVLEAESYNVSVTLKGRTGISASTVVKAVNTETGAALGARLTNGAGVARLPKGRYDFQALEVSDHDDVTLLAQTGVTVDKDRALTLDATAGKPVITTVEHAQTALLAGELSLVSGNPSGERTSALGWLSAEGQRVYLVPTKDKVVDHTFLLAYRATLTGPESIYHLVFLERNAIPNGRFTARQRELAKVDARYYAQGAPAEGLRADYATIDAPGVNSGIYQAYPRPIPSKRTEYYTANPATRWRHLSAMFPPDISDVETTVSYRTYQPGSYATHWNRAPLGPALGDPALGFGVQRVDGTLSVQLAPLSGGDPEQFTVLAAGATGTTELSRDGVVLGASDLPGSGVFAIPDSPGRYTLRTTVRREVPWSVIGTSADISWTFQEGGTANPVPPALPVVRVAAEVDEQGRAPAGRWIPLRLVTQRQPGAATPRVMALRVETSTDDGATWRPAPTVHSGDGTGVAVVGNPPGPGFVSLRVTARDAEGNSVTQTVVRAYQVA
ncbi:S8 family serine peptidase [Actinokineospora sp. NBRC 105648]|uniref:S8 family peptidase n=1 Tax=Actinokineospora sp. NBRC 105648 TaxID=3032206 RepID=UPI0024A151F5|nr:S8 family serine peptidase [Actinokineospora sp. NBRC 105648]GLZ42850.1 serine protease [Actinokineospora sp. NBRC 105648]